ncbi:MAG: hypothetical protein Q9194_002321 [Teloschistes cf. exilis]
MHLSLPLPLLLLLATTALSLSLPHVHHHQRLPSSLQKRQESKTFVKYVWPDGSDYYPPQRNNNNNQNNNQNNDHNNNDQTTTPSSSSSSSGNDILSTLNKWRTAYGKNTLAWSSDMASTAANTGKLNHGICDTKMQHHAAEGAAEVIAPGSDNSMGQDLGGYGVFEISLISWLCEAPSGMLGGACGVQERVMKT